MAPKAPPMVMPLTPAVLGISMIHADKEGIEESPICPNITTTAETMSRADCQFLTRKALYDAEVIVKAKSEDMPE